MLKPCWLVKSLFLLKKKKLRRWTIWHFSWLPVWYLRDGCYQLRGSCWLQNTPWWRSGIFESLWLCFWQRFPSFYLYCNIWHVHAIPTYRVYRLCDIAPWLLNTPFPLDGLKPLDLFNMSFGAYCVHAYMSYYRLKNSLEEISHVSLSVRSVITVYN